MSASTTRVHAAVVGGQGVGLRPLHERRSTAARGCSRPPATAAAPRAARPRACSTGRPSPSRTTASSALGRDGLGRRRGPAPRASAPSGSGSSGSGDVRRHFAAASSSSSTISASTTSSSGGRSAAGVARRPARSAGRVARPSRAPRRSSGSTVEQGRVLGLDLVDVRARERGLQLADGGLDLGLDVLGELVRVVGEQLLGRVDELLGACCGSRPPRDAPCPRRRAPRPRGPCGRCPPWGGPSRR